MTLKLESTTTELRKRVCKSREDYGKNWMHFVYKQDHLFQSTRVSDENSSVSKAFHFSKLISTQDLFCMQHSKPHTKISTIYDFICYFFMHLMIYFELNDPVIGKHYN